MNLNKKVIQSMTVASTLLAMTTITVLGGSTEDTIGKVTGNVTLDRSGTAGIVLDLGEKNLSVFSENDMMVASIVKPQRDIVSERADISGEPDETEPIVTEAVEAENTETESSEELGVFSQKVLEEGTADAVSGLAELRGFAAEMVAQDIETALDDLEREQADVQPVEDNAQVVDEAAVSVEEEVGIKAEAVEVAGAAVEVESAEAAEAVENVETAALAEEQPQEESEWSNRVMANVEEDMNIRTAPDENSELAGKFYRGDVAEVISVEGEWTQIVSGNATGYVKNEYLVYGNEAGELANEVCSMYATVNTDGLRLRSEPSEAAGIVTTAGNGDKLKVDKTAEAVEGWIPVHTSDATAYVSADYVEVALNLGTALNSEEVAAKEAKAAKEAEKVKKPAANANADEVTLLGALIQCEAGSGSYEGMVAVGAVVMNRVRSGSYPGSISGVIYQGGQFTPALNGSVASVVASGVRSACLQAAREAIGGTDNTNGALSFRSAASGYQGTVIGANVFF